MLFSCRFYNDIGYKLYIMMLVKVFRFITKAYFMKRLLTVSYKRIRVSKYIINVMTSIQTISLRDCHNIKQKYMHKINQHVQNEHIIIMFRNCFKVLNNCAQQKEVISNNVYLTKRQTNLIKHFDSVLET